MSLEMSLVTKKKVVNVNVLVLLSATMSGKGLHV